MVYWKSPDEQLLEMLPEWSHQGVGKQTGELAKALSLETDKMRSKLEKLRKKGKVRRMPRGGYVWFRTRS